MTTPEKIHESIAHWRGNPNRPLEGWNSRSDHLQDRGHQNSNSDPSLQNNINNVEEAETASQVKKQLEAVLNTPGFEKESSYTPIKVLLDNYESLSGGWFASLGNMHLKRQKNRLMNKTLQERLAKQTLERAKSAYGLLEGYSTKNSALDLRLNLAMAMFKNYLDKKPLKSRPTSYMEALLTPKAFLEAVHKIVGSLDSFERLHKPLSPPCEEAEAA